MTWQRQLFLLSDIKEYIQFSIDNFTLGYLLHNIDSILLIILCIGYPKWGCVKCIIWGYIQMKLNLYETHISIIANLFQRSLKFGAHLHPLHPSIEAIPWAHWRP